MVANTYLKTEDVPNMADPKTAVELYRQQRETLVTIENATDAMQVVHEILSNLWDQAPDDDTKNRINAAYARANELFAMSTAYNATLSGADMAIETIQKQRDELAEELEDLLDAINMGDEHHPKLESWVTDIRDMVTEEVYDQAYEQGEVAGYSDGSATGFDDGYESAQYELDASRDDIAATAEEAHWEHLVSEMVDLAGSLGVNVSSADAGKLLSALTGDSTLNAEQERATRILFILFGGEMVA